MGYKLNLKHSVTFNEKLQWLKLHDHNPMYSMLVDKYRVKDYVAKMIGPEHVIPTIAVYNSVDEIDLDKLPNQFVLKCNHDSGSVVICRDKSKFDLETAKQRLAKAMQHNFYWDGREWAYKKVKRVVFAEQYVEDKTASAKDDKDLLTYKFLCFNGEPYICYVTVKNEAIWENYYDLDFKPLDIHRNYPACAKPIAKPKNFEKMKELARILSQSLIHVRIDLYGVNEQVYFSEYTFYDWGGFSPFNDEWEKRLGDLIQLKK